MKREVVFFNDFGVSCSEERDKTHLLNNSLRPFDLCNWCPCKVKQLHHFISVQPYNSVKKNIILST